VKKRYFISIFIFIPLYLMTLSTLTFASDKDIVKVQGLIMELDLKKNIMIVNERSFTWDQKTLFHNDKGSPVKVEVFKPKAWVYIVGEQDVAKKRTLIKKIYLLPKQVDNKDRQRYPFMD